MSFAADRIEETALDEIRGDYPLADAHVIESLATAAHARVVAGDAEALAIAAGCVVHARWDVPIEGVVYRHRVIVVRAHRDRRRVTLAILHELAHVLLERAGVGHSHGDVWCLTLALAYPLALVRVLRQSCRLTVAELHWSAQVPAWAARERLAMPAVRLAR